jgi:cytochrome b6-f complex iron-sulfur subunit
MAHSNRVQTKSPPLNRREFLYYALGGSIVLAAGGAGAGLLRYMMPEPGENDLTQFVTLSADDLPSWDIVWRIPDYNSEDRFFRIRLNDTLLMLNWFCTNPRGGCLVKWVVRNYRFECPCCGSKFQIDGTYHEGSTYRGLDRYFTEVTFADGTTATSNETGDPIPLLGREIASVSVDTRRIIPGPARKSGV